MTSSGVNLVMTVIGFAVSILFIVFVCTRLICARIQLRTARRSFQTSSRSNLSIPWVYHSFQPDHLSEWKRKEMLLQRLQMARILSNIPVSRGGPTSLVIYDIHALLGWLKKQKDALAPEKEDVGSKVMWTSGLVFGRGEVVCNKVREDDKRIVRIKEGNPAGCHVVIIDDLVQSGSPPP